MISLGDNEIVVKAQRSRDTNRKNESWRGNTECVQYDECEDSASCSDEVQVTENIMIMSVMKLRGGNRTDWKEFGRRMEVERLSTTTVTIRMYMHIYDPIMLAY